MKINNILLSYASQTTGFIKILSVHDSLIYNKRFILVMVYHGNAERKLGIHAG